MPHEVGFGPRPYKYGGNPEQRIALQPGLDTPINIKIRENLNFGGGLGGSDYYSHSYGSNGYDSFDIKFKASVGGTGFVQNTGFSWGMFAQNALGALMNVGMFAMMAKWFGGNNAAAGTGINPLFNNFGGLTGGNYGGTFDLAHSYVTPFTPTATTPSTTTATTSTPATTTATTSTATTSTPATTTATTTTATTTTATTTTATTTTATTTTTPTSSSPAGAVSSGDGVPTGAYLKTLINSDAAGTVKNQAPGTSEYEGVDSLKKNGGARAKWADKVNGTPKTTSTTSQNYTDAVKLGKAGNAEGADETVGDYPKYFTITDYRSHNEYTFEFSQVKDGKVLYKWNQSASNLTKDDTDKYNGTNWIANNGFNANTEFEVTVAGGDIKLSYNGEQLSVRS